MKRQVFLAGRLGIATVASIAAASLLAWAQATPPAGPPPPTTMSPVLGQALPGLTTAQQQLFRNGLAQFSTTETRADNLGVIFNGVSCAECHKSGAIGGAGMDLTISRETRIGEIVNGQYSDLTNVGGPTIQQRSQREFDLTCPVSGEVVPPQANFVSQRITLPLFGDGLIEAIPVTQILAPVGKPDPDGITGVPNMVVNPDTGETEVGRFGWKAQHSTLHVFAADAYFNEMGVINSLFPNPLLPQGRPIPPGFGPNASPADEDDDVAAFTSYMQLLAPPGRIIPVSPQAESGAVVFQTIRCAACHTPSMTTGANAVTALSKQPVFLYSDLLLHHMGPGLADGIRQGTAVGDQFRTSPLWGLSRRQFLMHDGRAQTTDNAIREHGGEASTSVTRYTRLSNQDREALLAFLGSL